MMSGFWVYTAVASLRGIGGGERFNNMTANIAKYLHMQ